MDVYNERNGVEFVAHFETQTGDPAIPLTVHWGLVCESTQKTLQALTSVDFEVVTDETGVVDVTAAVTVPGSLNAIQDNGNWKELKKLLVVKDKDLDGELSKEYLYYVKNLRGRS